jgi:hypothetical protein
VVAGVAAGGDVGDDRGVVDGVDVGVLAADEAMLVAVEAAVGDVGDGAGMVGDARAK